jgi:hypothetical protein
VTPEPKTEPAQAGLPARARRRRRRRAGVWTVSVLLLAMAAAIYFGLDRTLFAPDWLRQRISERIEGTLQGQKIEFGSVEFVINHGWRPRVRLRDVVLTRADGTLLAQLSDVEASLAMRPLLRGQLQPKRIFLGGAYATLRREAGGAVALRFGEQSAAPLEQAANFAQLIEQGDRLLLAPQLSALQQIEMTALTLRYEDQRSGKAWTLDGGHVLLVRDGDSLRLSSGFSLLSGRDYASSVEASYASRIGDAEAEISINISEMPSEDIAAQTVALAWLDVLRAPISGALRGSIDSDGVLGPLSATLQIGEGVLQPSDQTRPIPFHGARSYFTFDPERLSLAFDELSVNSGWGSSTAEGIAYLGLDEQGQLKELLGQFRFHDLSFNPRSLYAETRHLKGVSTDVRLELAPFKLTLGEMLINDGDSMISLSGALEAAQSGWKVALDGHLDQMDVSRVVALWPQALASKPRQWVADNLQQGTLERGNFALRATEGDKPAVFADFTYRDATIRYLKTLPPITDGAGMASLLDGRFVVTASAGTVTPDEGQPIDVAGTSFIIPDVSITRAAPGIVRLVGQADVTAILSLLNRPPLQVLKNTDLPVDMVQGLARVTGTLAVPLKDRVQLEDLRYHFTGEVTQVRSTVLVPGHTLRADRLSVVGDQSGLTVKGSGRLDDLRISAVWDRPIGPDVGPASQVRGTVELSPRTVSTFNLGLPAGSVRGEGSGAYAVTLGTGGAPMLTLDSDLKGIDLSLPVLGWRKPASQTGRLALSGTLGPSGRIDKLELQGGGLQATGSVINREGGGLDRAVLSSVRIGSWLEAAVELTGRPGQEPGIRVLNGRLDLRTAPFGAAGSAPSAGSAEVAADQQAGPITARLDRLQITDNIALTGFTGAFTSRGGFSGTFDGRLNGGTAVRGQIVPQPQGTAFRVLSDDAGGVFRDAGVLEHGRGGSFEMTLLPTDAPGEFEGQLSVRDTRVKDAPAIAALINAVSLVGLVDEMAGNGIKFNAVQARFRLGPSSLTLYESSAEGPSIGLSMDGSYDLARGVLNMQGVISPVYLLNAIGSVLTRKGEGVFGFTYTLTGPSKDPQVQVNPLSALAPAMLRNLFRNPSPEAPALPGQPEPDQRPKPAPSAGDR